MWWKHLLCISPQKTERLCVFLVLYIVWFYLGCKNFPSESLTLLVWAGWLTSTPYVWKVSGEGADTVLQKSSRSSGHQSSRHRTRDKSRDRDQERDRDKDWPPEKLSDSHSPVSLREGIAVFSWCILYLKCMLLICNVSCPSESATEVSAQTPAPVVLILQPDGDVWHALPATV